MDLFREDSLVEALDASSPADVVQSQRLLSSFRSFLSRGSAENISILLSSSKAKSRASHMTGPGPSVQDTTEPFVGAGGPAGIVGTWVGRDGQSRVTKESQDALLFLKDRVLTPKRLQNLLRVVDGVLNAPRQPASFYRNLWSTYSHCIFSDVDPAQTRIARLLTGIKHIDQESQRFESAGRISLVFLAHDIEAVKDQDMILAPGQTRQNVAVLSIAQQLRVDCNEIKKKWRRGRNYIKLLERCGPASLLELGTGVNWYWEKALTKEDVDVFVEFFEAKLPHLSSRVKDLNEAAGNMFVDGMLAYGWTMESIFGTDSRLRQALALHCPGLFRTPPRPFQDPRTWESLKTTDGSRGLVLDVTTSREHAWPNEFTDLAEHPIEQLSRFHINANPKQCASWAYSEHTDLVEYFPQLEYRAN